MQPVGRYTGKRFRGDRCRRADQEWKLNRLQCPWGKHWADSALQGRLLARVWGAESDHAAGPSRNHLPCGAIATERGRAPSPRFTSGQRRGAPCLPPAPRTAAAHGREEGMGLGWLGWEQLGPARLSSAPGPPAAARGGRCAARGNRDPAVHPAAPPRKPSPPENREWHSAGTGPAPAPPHLRGKAVGEGRGAAPRRTVAEPLPAGPAGPYRAGAAPRGPRPPPRAPAAPRPRGPRRAPRAPRASRASPPPALPLRDAWWPWYRPAGLQLPTVPALRPPWPIGSRAGGTGSRWPMSEERRGGAPWVPAGGARRWELGGC